MSRYGLFKQGSICYAVPLLHLRKIVHERAGYLLPQLPTSVAEVLVDEGLLIPLLRFSFLSEGEPSERQAEYKVFAESEGGLVAFPAELTSGIIAQNKGELLPPGEEKIPGIDGSFNYQGKEFKILDINYLAIGMTQEV